MTFDEEWQSVYSLNKLTHQSGPACGGGMLLVQLHLRFRTIKIHTSRFIQAVVGILMDSPIVECYVSSQTPAEIFREFLKEANGWLTGPSILVGHLKIRDRTWDYTTNRRGAILHRWAAKHIFRKQGPPYPTLVNAPGGSRVDLCFHRTNASPILSVNRSSSLSDHVPVTA